MVLKIEYADLTGMNVVVKPTGDAPPKPHNSITSFAYRNWGENNEGWSSAFVPVARRFVPKDEDQGAIILADTGNYFAQMGSINAIAQGREEAPKAVNGMGITTYTVTADGKIMLPRRSMDIQHAPGFYNTFCGWMSSMNIAGRVDCEDVKYALDPRLFDAKWQAHNEFIEESGLAEADFTMDEFPTSITRAYGESFNLGLGFVGRISLESDKVRRAMLKNPEEFAPGRYEHDKIASISINDLEELIRKQPEIYRDHGANPLGYKPSDPAGKDLFILDETLGGLIAHYEAITGQPRPSDLVSSLTEGGIAVYEKTPAEMIVAA